MRVIINVWCTAIVWFDKSARCLLPPNFANSGSSGSQHPLKYPFPALLSFCFQRANPLNPDDKTFVFGLVPRHNIADIVWSTWEVLQKVKKPYVSRLWKAKTSQNKHSLADWQIHWSEWFNEASKKTINNLEAHSGREDPFQVYKAFGLIAFMTCLACYECVCVAAVSQPLSSSIKAQK